MSPRSKEPVFDDDNPEWTEEDFARARPPEEVLPPEILAQFKHHRGPQRAPTKVPVSIRLSADVVAHYKATGPGWQSRIDETLRKAAKLKTG
uniref:BrnA antitoxin family protein n=1 Tax=Rhodopseudomonas palustris (strain DX-1) TaxID=652103 RepID=E6VHL3_RHOPX